jgi:hypothetical protein
MSGGWLLCCFEKVAHAYAFGTERLEMGTEYDDCGAGAGETRSEPSLCNLHPLWVLMSEGGGWSGQKLDVARADAASEP